MLVADRLADAIHRLRRLVRGHWLVLPLALLLVYFLWHAVHGRRGLVALLDLERELAAAQQELARLESERAMLEERVEALSPGAVDADLLESELRRLGYVRPDELVILAEPGARPEAADSE
ncbi:hypothetical protein HRbin40_01300 [bacterium HR40]|nr:hypothetical protein HRbin40_01300 [bacterium HR40]